MKTTCTYQLTHLFTVLYTHKLFFQIYQIFIIFCLIKFPMDAASIVKLGDFILP